MRFLPIFRALLAAAALLSGGFATSWAASVSYVGGGGSDNWYDSANWSGAVVPGVGDDVTIDLSVTVTVSASSPALVFQTLTLGGGNSPILRMSTGIESGYLEIRSGATLLQDTAVELQLTSVTVLSGGAIDHNNGGVAKVNIVTTGDFVFASGATINVDGDGFAGGAAAGPPGIVGLGSQPGAGGVGANEGGGGGGHGGVGGAGGGGAAGGGSDDSISAPILHGSGGGGGGDGSTVGTGGVGGGLVLLSVGGTLDLSGTITADGSNGTNSGQGAGGGGAGGAIYIQTVNMAGGGSISVDGGNGGISGGGPGAGGGGGGAGRAAIVFTGTNVSTITYSANLGSLGANGGVNGSFGTAFDQPVNVTDLSAVAIVNTGIGHSSQTVRLQWTSPKVGIAGASNNWDIRYATFPIDSQSVYDTLSIDHVISTSVVEGLIVSTDIAPLDPRVTWYFALTTSDQQNLRSTLSNAATAQSYIATSTGSSQFSYGAVWGDADNDGDLDLWISNSNTQNDVVMENLGGGAFNKITVLVSNLDSRGIALADFDEDGDLDAVVAATGANEYMIENNFVPTGVLSFSTRAVAATVAGAGRGAAAADVDNDGDIDIAISLTSDQDEYIIKNELRETGSLSFSSYPVADTNENSRGIAFADYDKDGDIDLAWSNTIGGSHDDEVIALNDGFGSYSTHTIEGTDNNSRGAAWADYDADGDYDLLVVSRDGNPALLLRNDGFLNFTEVPIANSGGEGYGVAWGDFDNDGDLDAAIARHEGEDELLLVNDGSGGLDAFAMAGSSGASIGISWGDSDGDGDLDLAVAQDNNDDEGVLRNDINPTNIVPGAPTGVFGASFEEYFVGATSGTLSMSWPAATDTETNANNLKYFVRIGTAGTGTQGIRRIPPVFSFDGYSGGGSEIYSTWLSASQRGIKTILSVETTAHWAVVTEDSQLVRSAESSEQTTTLVAPSLITDLAAVMVSTGFAASSTSIHLTWTTPGDDGESFAITGGTFDVRWSPSPIASLADYIAAPYSAIITTSVSPGVIASTDIPNFDPLATWYFAITTKDSIGVRSAMSLPATAQAFVRVFQSGDRSNGVAWGDFDNDGDLDYVVANNDADERLYTNDGSGKFTESSIDATAEGRGVALADYDVDGDLDILVARHGIADNILRNDGGGTFTPVSAQTSASTQTLAVAWGDYDNDGDLDFAAATDTGEDAYLATNDGDGTFSTSTLSGVSGLCQSLAWGDYNEDGFLDLAVGCASIEDYLLTNVNGSTFTYSLLTAGGSNISYGVAWVDVDEDGDLDLAVASSVNSYYLRNNAGVLSAQVLLSGATGGGQGGIAAGDFDDDGDIDLAISNNANQSVEIAYNDGLGSGTFEVFLVSRTASGGAGQGISAGDMDGDGDLDLAMVRWDGGEDILISNDVLSAHSAPSAPTGLNSSFGAFSSFATSGTLSLTWNDASDTETTDADLLEYLVRVGTTVAGSSTTLKFPSLYSNDGYSGHGFLYSTRLSASQRGIKLFMQTETTVYWSVMTVDASGARSVASSENSIDLSAPSAISDIAVTQDATVETSSTSFVTLVFTAPGENGDSGNLGATARYDVRWTTGGPIDTQEKYVGALHSQLMSAEGTAGASVSLKVSVEAGRTQYFAVTTIDSGGVRSGISNSPSQIVDGMRELITDTAVSQVLQNTTTGFLKLQLWTETGQVRWTKLRLAKEGSLPDASISNVIIFRDVDADGIFTFAGDGSGGRSLAAVFSSSATELTVSPVQTITGSTQTYFVAMAFNNEFLPIAGTSVGVRLNGEAFSVSSGGVVGIDYPAIQFDGTDDSMIAPYSASMDVGATAVTLEAWVKTSDMGADLSVITRGNVAGNSGYRLWLNGNGGGCGGGVPTFYVGSSFLCASDGTANVSIADGEWHHVAATFVAGTGGKFFIDGQPLASGAMGGTLSDSSNNLGVGGPNATGGNFFIGEIDEIRVSAFARYPAELPPARRNNTTGAVMLYHFDTVFAGTNTFADATTNNNDIVLHGDALSYGRSTSTHINDVQDIVFATATDISPSLLFRNSSNIGIMKLELWTNRDRVTLSQLSVESTGTGNDGGVTNLQLFLDNGDGLFDSGSDVSLVSSVDFFQSTAVFTLSVANQQLLSPTTKAFFVSWDVGGSADDGLTLGLELTTTSNFVLTGSTDIVSTDDFPLQTVPVTVVTAEVLVDIETPTGTWVNTSSIVFQGTFGTGNVDHYRYLFNQSPATVITGGGPPEVQWVVGKTTVTATADANDWYFHVRAFDSNPTAGLQNDFGPYFIDQSAPLGGTFQHYNDAGGTLTDSQFNDLATSVTAQIFASDAASGLNIDGPSPLAESSGTVSLWHFDGASGSFVDSGHAQNFLAPLGAPDRAAGRFGGGIQTSPGNYLRNLSPVSLPVLNEDRTIEAWVLPRSTQGIEGIVSWGSGGNVFAIQLNAGVLEADLGGAAVSNGPVLSTGVWQHVAFSFDGNAGSFYVNGAPVGTNVYGAQTTSAGTLEVGRSAGGGFDGTIDDVRISRRVIAASEILKDYEYGNPYWVSYSTDAGRSWRVIASTIPGPDGYVTITGSHGTTVSQTMKVLGLDLIVSTLTFTGSQATNQVRFHPNDVAGNTLTSTPFSVLVDTNIGVAYSTPSVPGDGRYVGVNPDFNWTGPSTSLVQGLGGEFFLEVSSGDAAFAPANIDIDVAVSAGVTDILASKVTGVYNSTYTLTEGTTYYWRVRSRSSLGVMGDYGPVHSFVTDITSPTGSGFLVQNSTNGIFTEAEYIDLLSGVTAQLTVQDVSAGLSHPRETVVPSGAVAMWTFSELDGLSQGDAAGNGNVGTLACSTPGSCSPAVLGATPRGAGLVCAAGKGMTAVNTNFNFTANSNFSVSAWVNPSTLIGNRVIAAVGAATDVTNTNWVFLISNNGRLNIVNNTGGGFQTASPVVFVNTWQHVAVSVEGGAVRYYLNGKLVEQGGWSGNSGGGSMPFSVCSGIQDSLVWESGFLGEIDDLVVYNTAISAPEVGAHYENGKPGGFSVEYSTNVGANWNVVSATAGLGGNPWVEISGVDGDTSARTFSVRDLALTHSIGTGVGASGTNQVRFYLSDRSDNFITAGPYSIIIDTVAAAAVSTPTFPLSGQYVRRTPNFRWGGPSTVTAAGMGSSAFFLLEVDDDANFASPEIFISTPVRIGSTNTFNTAGTYLSSQTLVDNTTYHWRVRPQDYLGLLSPALTINTFVTDFSSPTFQSFASINSTGGAAVEAIGIDLLVGVTVQVTLQDGGPAGIATAPINGVTPFGVLYTTEGAAGSPEWRDGDFARSFGLGSVADTYSLEEFQGKLYAGASGSEIYVYDGNTWQLSVDLGAGSGAVALKEFNGELYAGQTGSGEIWKFNGAWALFFDHGGGETRALEEYAGKLYAGTDGLIWEYDPIGGWTVAFDPTDATVFSLKSFSGELFAGANPNLYKFDGSSWTLSNVVSASTLDLEELNGKLYAATNNSGNVNVYDGSSWSLSIDLTNETVVAGFGVFAGRLYAGAHQPGSISRIYVFDGRDWLGIRTMAGVNDIVYDFAEFNARLYSAAHVDPAQGVVFVTTPTVASISGPDGSTALQTLTAEGLTVLPSANALTCGGATSCLATNQVRFTYADKTGEGGAVGPFAILADPLLSAPTGYSPLDGDFIRSNSASLSWVEASTQTLHDVEVAVDASFTPTIFLNEVATNTSNLNTTPSLSQATTYFWRVRGVNASAIRSEYSPTRSFVVDTISPALGTYNALNSTSGVIAESAYVNLNQGVTVQFQLQDGGSGLGLLGFDSLDRVGVWSFEDILGATVTDRSGNGNDAILTAAALRFAAGKIGRGVRFPSGTDYVLTSTQSTAGWDGMTIAGWVRALQDNVSFKTIWASRQFRFYAKSDQGRVAYHYDPSGAVPTENGGCSFTTGQVHPVGAWVHVALTLHPGENAVYIDGVKQGSCNSGPSGATPNDTRYSIGGDALSGIGGINSFTGDIDEIRIYSRVLTTAELKKESVERGFSVQYSTNAGQTWQVASSTFGSGAKLTYSALDSSAAQESFSVEGLTLTESTNTIVCAGAEPCFATNQVRIYGPDRAGNILRAGPFSVLIDTSVPLPLMTSLTPLSTDTIYVTATATDNLSGLNAFNFEASTSAAFAFPVSSSNFLSQSTYTFSGLLSAATYYVRVVTRDDVLNISTPAVALATSTFGSVFFGTFTATPAAAGQDALVSMLGFTLNTKPGVTSGFRGLTLTRTGTGGDVEIEDVRIYRDEGDSVFSGTEVNVGPPSVIFTSSQAVITLQTPENVTVLKSTYFVVYKIAPGATVLETLGVEISSAGAVNLEFPASAEGPFPSQSAIIPISDGANTVVFTETPYVPLVTEAQVGTPNFPVLQLLAQTDVGTSLISSMVFRLNGSISNSEIVRYNVWRDAEPDGLFDPNLDEKLTGGSDAFDPTRISTVVFSVGDSPISSRTVTTAPRRFFVSVDLSGVATTDLDFSIAIATESSIGLGNPLDIVGFSQPGEILGTTMTVVLNNEITLGLADKTTNFLTQGQQYAVIRASIVVDGATSTFDQFQINRTGTGVDGDVNNVSIYKDEAPLDVFGDLLDTFLASGTFTSQTVSLSFATQTLTSGNTVFYYVVYDMDGAANPGNTIGAQIGLGGLRVTNVNTALNASLPFNTANIPVAATINQLLVTNAVANSVGQPTQGAADYTMLRMDIASSGGDFLWQNLVVDKLGTAASTDVAKVNLFRDFDGDQLFDVAIDSRITNDAQTFDAGGSVNLSLTQVQSVTLATQTYFVTVSLDPDAGPGGTIGLQIPSTAAFNIDAPHTINPDIQSFPLPSSIPIINPFQNTISLTSAAVVNTGAEIGEVNVGIMSLILKTDVSKANWQSIKLNQSGSALQGDIDAVKLYLDFNGFGIWNPANVANYQLVSSSTQTFDGSGNVTLAFSTPPVISATPAEYFLVVDVSTNAVPDGNIVVRVSTGANFVFNSPNKADPNATFTSVPLTLTPPPVTMFVQGASSAPALGTQGDSNVVMLRLEAWTDQFDAEWSALTLGLTGTGSAADIDSVNFYRDVDGNGILDAGLDGPLVGSGTFSGSTALINFGFLQTITASTQTYFVAYNLNKIATAGATLGARIAASGDVDIDTPPNSVDPSGFPNASSLMTVQATESRMFVAKASLSPGTLDQGATHQVLLSLTLNTTQFALPWNSLTLASSGTAADSDISAVNIWRDIGAPGQVGKVDVGTDTLITSGNDAFSGGSVILGFPAEEIDLNNKDYLVTVSVDQFADPGKTIAVVVQSSAAFGVTAPNFVDEIAPVYPFGSDVNTTISKVSEEIFFTVTDVGPTGLNQGAELAFARIDAYSTRYRAEWNGIFVHKLDSLSNLDVTAVNVYRDSDLSGAFSAADLLIGSGTYTGTSISDVIFSSKQAISPSTNTYFVTLQVPLSATVGTQVRLNFGFIDFAGTKITSPDSAAPVSLSFTNAQKATILNVTVPTKPTVTIDSPYSSNFEFLHFVWSSTVAVGSFSGALYAVGTTPGGFDVVNWTALAANQTDVEASGFPLLQATTYYVSVKSQANGEESPVGTADPVLMDFQSPNKPAPGVTAGDTTLLITWATVSAGPSGIMGYLVEYRSEQNPVWINAKTGAKSGTQALAVPSGLSPLGAITTLAVSSASVVTGNSFQATNVPQGTVFVRVRSVSGSGVASESSEIIKVQLGPLPSDGINSASSYPNPFDSRTTTAKIFYELAENSGVTITIYSIFGRELNSLSFDAGGVGGSAGANTVTWDGSDLSGRKVTKGMYIAVIEAGGARETLKIGVIH